MSKKIVLVMIYDMTKIHRGPCKYAKIHTKMRVVESTNEGGREY